jgi:hypothetical protein
MIQIKKFESKTDQILRKLWDEDHVQNCYRVLSEHTYKKIVSDFFKKNNRIDILTEAINSEKTAIILKECHSLRGASSMIGLIAFNDIIDSIEQSSSNQKQLKKSEVINALNDLLTDAQEHFLKITIVKE